MQAYVNNKQTKVDCWGRASMSFSFTSVDYFQIDTFQSKLKMKLQYEDEKHSRFGILIMMFV